MPEVNLIDAKSGKLISFPTAKEANEALLKTDRRNAPLYGADALTNYMMFDKNKQTISTMSGGEINKKLGEQQFYGNSFVTEEQTATALHQKQQELVGEAYEHIHGIDAKAMARIYGIAKGLMPIGVESAAQTQGLGGVAKYLRENHKSDIEMYEYGIPLTQLGVGLGLMGAAALAGSTAAPVAAVTALGYAGLKHLPKWVTKGGPEFIKMMARNQYVIAAAKGAKGAFDILNWQMRGVHQLATGSAKLAQATLKVAKPITTGGKIAALNISPTAAVPMVNMLLKNGGTFATATAKGAAYSATTGALYSVGAYETKKIVGDVEYSAENFMNHVMDGALFDVGLTGLVLSATAGGRFIQEKLRKVPVVGPVTKVLPLLPRIDLSGQMLNAQSGMAKTVLKTVGMNPQEKFTVDIIRAATKGGVIDNRKLNKLLKTKQGDTDFAENLHFMLNDAQFGRDHGLDGPMMHAFDKAEDLIPRMQMVQKKALKNRNQAESDLDNSARFEAERAKNSLTDEAEEALAKEHHVDLDSKIQRLADLEQQKKNLAQGKDEASVMRRRIAEKQRIGLENKINRIKRGEATTQEVLEELDHLDTNQGELDSLNLIHSEEGGEGVMRARGQVLHDTGAGDGGQLVHNRSKEIQIEDEWNAYNASNKHLADKELNLDDYIYTGKTEDIDLDLERGMLQEAMVTIRKTTTLGNELDDSFQQRLAEILETFELEGSLLDDLGWRIVTIDGKKTLEGFSRSIAKPATPLRKAYTQQVEPAPIAELADVAYNSLRASRDLFTAHAKKKGLELKGIVLAKRSDIRQEKEALKGRPKPPSAESAGYKEEKIKRVVLKKLAQKKTEMGQSERRSGERAKTESELLDGEIVAAKEDVDRLSYDIIPAKRHPGSKSVEFNQTADDLLLSIKRRHARENAPAPTADTPYSASRFKESGKSEIEHAEKIAADWRLNGDNTTFTEAQTITSDLGALTYGHDTQDYKTLNKVNNEAFKLLRSQLESKIQSTARWSMGEVAGDGVLAAFVDGNRTFHVLESVLNSTSNAAAKNKGWRDLWSWPIQIIGRRLGLSGPSRIGLMAAKAGADNFLNAHSLPQKARSKYVYELNKMTKWANNVNSEMTKGINSGRKLVKDTSVKFVEGLGVPPGSVYLRFSAEAQVAKDRPPEEEPKRGPGRPRKEPKEPQPTSALFTPMDVLAVNREGDRAGDSRRDAYWKRAREISAAVKRPLDTDNILTAAYEPIAMWDAPLAEHIKLNAQKELEYLGSILTKRYDMQGNPEPTMAEIDRLELALNVLANTKASIYDRFLDGTLDNFSMEVFNNLRPKSAIEFKEAVADIGQRYGHMIPYQKQLVMAKITDMNLGSVPTADLTNGIQAVVYAPDEQQTSMGNKPLGIASRTETPLEKGVQRDEWGVRARPDMTLGMV